jgi:hypothetical protein
VCVILPGRLLHGRTLDIIFSSSSFPCQLARLFYHHREGGMRGLVACLPGGWLAGWLHDIFYTRTLFGPNEEILLCSSRRDARATQQASILLLINLRSALQRKITASARQPLFSLDTICVRRVFDHYSHTRYCCCCPAYSGERSLPLDLRRLCSLLLSFQKHPLIELEFACQIKESRYLRIEFPCAPVDLHFYIYTYPCFSCVLLL